MYSCAVAAGALALLSATDHVYYINLDSSSRRRAHMEGHLEACGLSIHKNYTRIAATDGSTLVPAKNALFPAVSYSNADTHVLTWDLQSVEGFGGINSKMVALSLSHIRAIHTAYKEGRETALIFEDDVDLREPEWLGAEDVSRALELLPPGWTIFQLGAIVASEVQVDGMRRAFEHGGQLARHRDPCGSDWTLWGTFAYIISRKGMRRVLERYWPGGIAATAAAPREHVGGDDDTDDGSYSGGSGGGGSGGGGSGGGGPSFFVDMRRGTNLIWDHALYNMEGVFVATRPIVLPPSPDMFNSTMERQDSDGHHGTIARARALLEAAFRGAAAPPPDRFIVGLPSFRGWRRYYLGNARPPLLNTATRSFSLALSCGPPGARDYGGCAYLATKLWNFVDMCVLNSGRVLGRMRNVGNGGNETSSLLDRRVSNEHSSSEYLVVDGVAQFYEVAIPRPAAAAGAAMARYCDEISASLSSEDRNRLIGRAEVMARGDPPAKPAGPDGRCPVVP